MLLYWFNELCEKWNRSACFSRRGPEFKSHCQPIQSFSSIALDSNSKHCHMRLYFNNSYSLSHPPVTHAWGDHYPNCSYRHQRGPCCHTIAPILHGKANKIWSLDDIIIYFAHPPYNLALNPGCILLLSRKLVGSILVSLQLVRTPSCNQSLFYPHQGTTCEIGLLI